ncbi:unnamed protein product [Darwinula stevensoni]|uniref:Uncharacterized protein n=1 Tax=Darwinula stevensoni TaxID=69355 RepID=A0A7R9FQA7_9CRUS|nr:unnamed protein product [Darwinula stevensoni]CAG0899425.1 unnamed protein product [Darwinula stevensoni]
MERSGSDNSMAALIEKTRAQICWLRGPCDTVGSSCVLPPIQIKFKSKKAQLDAAMPWLNRIFDRESDSEESPQKEIMKGELEDDALCKGSDEKDATCREEKGTDGLDQYYHFIKI